MNDDERPVLAFDDPITAAYPHDAIRAAAADLAQRATNRYVALLSGHAAHMIREVFGDQAHRVLFQQDTSSDGLTSIDLLCVYNDAGQLIWYDIDSGLHRTSAVLERDHDEATGGPITARLEQHSKQKIEELISLAQHYDWDGSWFNDTDLILTEWDHSGTATQKPYGTWLLELLITQEITFAAEVRADLALHHCSERTAPGAS